MKKKLRLPPEERKKQLEKCIIKAVSKYGISRVTHSHVAKLAGVSVSTVHFYFKKRKDLVASAVKQVEDYLIDLFTRSLNQKSSVKALEDLAENFLDDGFSNTNLMRVWLDWSVGVRENNVWKDYQRLQDELHKMVRTVLSRAKREKLLPSNFDTLSAARVYIGTGHTLQLMVLNGHNKKEIMLAQKTLIRSVFLQK
tara:strand:- start:144 stop:734 length:591 start_codon:yes stop_codon:yes gene_type:complete